MIEYKQIIIENKSNYFYDDVGKFIPEIRTKSESIERVTTFFFLFFFSFFLFLFFFWGGGGGGGGVAGNLRTHELHAPTQKVSHKISRTLDVTNRLVSDNTGIISSIAYTLKDIQRVLLLYSYLGI